MKKYNIFSDKIDYRLLVCVIIASLTGILAINSAAASLPGHVRLVIVQSVAFVIGIIAMTAIMFFKYTYLEKIKYFVFGIGIALLVTVLAVGKLSHGMQGWIVLGPITLQPSEIAKICFVITMSSHISTIREEINKIKNILFLCAHFLCYAIPVLLQPDFGTTMVFAVIFAAELFFAGISKKYIWRVAGALAVISPIVWLFLADYQKKRIITLFNPGKDPTGSGYHVLQSELAIGSGQIFGRGYLSGPQTQFGYLPEKQTDFIFSVIGEEMGLIGACFVVILLLAIVYSCFDIAKSCEHDSFGELICVGVGAMLFFHMAENIGMCIGILPITGIPLPFISYGGSNLVTCFAAIGLVQSVKRNRLSVKFNV